MKLHLGSIGDHAQNSIIVEHVDPVDVPTIEDMKKKKEHNQAMLEISSALNYAKFYDIKGCTSVFKMQEARSLDICLWRRSECPKRKKIKPQRKV